MLGCLDACLFACLCRREHRFREICWILGEKVGQPVAGCGDECQKVGQPVAACGGLWQNLGGLRLPVAAYGNRLSPL